MKTDEEFFTYYVPKDKLNTGDRVQITSVPVGGPHLTGTVSLSYLFLEGEDNRMRCHLRHFVNMDKNGDNLDFAAIELEKLITYRYPNPFTLWVWKLWN